MPTPNPEYDPRWRTKYTFLIERYERLAGGGESTLPPESGSEQAAPYLALQELKRQCGRAFIKQFPTVQDYGAYRFAKLQEHAERAQIPFSVPDLETLASLEAVDRAYEAAKRACDRLLTLKFLSLRVQDEQDTGNPFRAAQRDSHADVRTEIRVFRPVMDDPEHGVGRYGASALIIRRESPYGIALCLGAIPGSPTGSPLVHFSAMAARLREEELERRVQNTPLYSQTLSGLFENLSRLPSVKPIDFYVYVPPCVVSGERERFAAVMRGFEKAPLLDSCLCDLPAVPALIKACYKDLERAVQWQAAPGEPRPEC